MAASDEDGWASRGQVLGGMIEALEEMRERGCSEKAIRCLTFHCLVLAKVLDGLDVETASEVVLAATDTLKKDLGMA